LVGAPASVVNVAAEFAEVNTFVPTVAFTWVTSFSPLLGCQVVVAAPVLPVVAVVGLNEVVNPLAGYVAREAVGIVQTIGTPAWVVFNCVVTVSAALPATYCVEVPQDVDVICAGAIAQTGLIHLHTMQIDYQRLQPEK